MNKQTNMDCVEETYSCFQNFFVLVLNSLCLRKAELNTKINKTHMITWRISKTNSRGER